MSAHIYGFDSVNHNWEPVNVTSSGKLETDTNVSITDTLNVKTDGSDTVAVTGDFYPATQPVSGSVSVSNHPTSIKVDNTVGGTLLVDGSAHTQPVSGSVAVSGSVSVSNHPTSIKVENVGGGTLLVDGSAHTQPVSGSVSVSNHPTSIKVENVGGGTLTVDGSGVTQPISGSVAVSTLPSTAATLAAQTAGNTSLATLAACENAANALQVDIQADAVGLATSAGQTSLETKLGELNDNNFTTETVSVSSQSMDNTASLNCTNYARFEVIAISSLTANATHVQIQWSDDNTNWYYPEFYQTIMTNYDADGSSNAQESLKMSSEIHGKYARVRLYNPSASSSDSVKVVMARIH